MRADRALAALAVVTVSVVAGGTAVRVSLLADDAPAAAVLAGIGLLVALAVTTATAGRPGSTPYW